MIRVKTLSALAVVLGGIAAASLVSAGQGQFPNQPPGNPVPGSAPVNIVSPLPLPVTGSIEVTTIDPLPTRDADVAAREPVQFRTSTTLFTGQGKVVLVTVPAGKRLVIEHVSGSVNDNSGTGITSCTLQSEEAGFPLDWLPCESMFINALNHIYAVNRQTKFYASPGAVVSFTASTFSDLGKGSLSAFASGYYEPVP